MRLPPRRLVTAISAALTLGWSLLCLGLLFTAGMAALRYAPASIMDAAGPLVTAFAVVAIAAGAGLLSMSGVWLFGGPALHAVEVWRADRLAHRPAAARPAPSFADRWLRVAHGATLLLLPAALALLFLAQ